MDREREVSGVMRVVSYCEVYLEAYLGSGSRGAEPELYFGSYEGADKVLAH